MKSHIVRTAIKIALVLLSWETLAVNKCDIDGKIVYQSSPCPPHPQENIKIEYNSEITWLRLIAHDDNSKTSDRYAAKLELVRRGEWKKSDEMSELKRDVEELKEMGGDANCRYLDPFGQRQSRHRKTAAP